QDYLEVLGGANEIVLDQEKWKNAPETNEEIREYLKDLKVCGPRELRKLLKWRKAMRAILEEELKALEEELGEENAPEAELNEDELEDKEMAEIDEMIARASEEEKAALKKKKKRMLKAKAKIIRRRQLKMIIEGDHADQVEDIELFSLKKIRRARELSKLTSDSVETPEVEPEEGEDGLGEGEWETRKGIGYGWRSYVFCYYCSFEHLFFLKSIAILPMKCSTYKCHCKSQQL
ncbi:hypothetical protein OESDEN_11458, partial [Oesophagostomum dentatum]